MVVWPRRGIFRILPYNLCTLCIILYSCSSRYILVYYNRGQLGFWGSGLMLMGQLAGIFQALLALACAVLEMVALSPSWWREDWGGVSRRRGRAQSRRGWRRRPRTRRSQLPLATAADTAELLPRHFWSRPRGIGTKGPRTAQPGSQGEVIKTKIF